MAKRVQNSDVIEPDLFGQTIKDGLAFKTVLIDINTQFATILKQSREFASKGNSGSVEGINKTTEAYKNAKVAADGYEKSDRLIAAADEKLNFVLSEKGKQLDAIRVKTQEATAANKEQARVINEGSGAYQKASANLRVMIKDYQNLAVTQKGNTKEALGLLKAIQQQDAELKKIDGTVGRHTRHVGDYARGTQGLRFSIAQLTREAPAFANSLQTGFMALSNNIPIFVDEIARLTEANKALNAEGQKTPSVFKSVAAAFFSLQTLLSGAVTFLVVFGQKIVENIGSMIGWTSATKLQKEEQEKLNKQLDETIEKTNTLIENQKDEIKFQTEALVLQAKMRGAAQAEIDEIEKAGREKEIRKLQDDLDRKNALYFKALEDKQNIDRQFANDEDKFKDLKLAADARFEKTEEAAKNSQIALDRAIAKNALGMRQEEFRAMEEKREADKQAAEEEKQRKLEALNLQHEINKALLASQDQGILIKQAIIMEDLAFEQAVNEIRISDKKKMHELNLALEKEARKKIKDLDDSLIDPYSPAAMGNPIKQDKLRSDIEKQRKKLASDKEKAQKEEIAQEKQFVNLLAKTYEDGAKRRQAAEQDRIDKEIDSNKKRQEDLRDLAAKGVQDANNNLAFEQRKAAELEAQRIKAEKNRVRIEMISSAMKAYAANIGQNPNGAAKKTLTDLTQLIAGLQAIPAFLEGTEDVGPGGKADEKGGFHAILHPNERVMTKEQNMKVGDLSNEELANLAFNYNLGQLAAPIVNHYHDDKAVSEIRELNNKMDQAIQVIKNRPVVHDQFDESLKLIKHVIRTETKTENIYRKPKLGGRRG